MSVSLESFTHAAPVLTGMHAAARVCAPACARVRQGVSAEAG